jgi:hypothetical protein
MLMLMEDVLPAMLLTIGMSIVKLAFHAPKIPIGIHQLENANAALRDSLSITVILNAHALHHTLTMTSPLKNALLAIPLQFGTKLTQDASAALKDLTGTPQLNYAIALALLHLLIQEPENALNAHTKSLFGMERPALLALLKQTTTLIQRPAQFALKDLVTMLDKELALSHDDYFSRFLIIYNN